MGDGNYALVLTGEVLPGYSPEAVWPALATYFRMDQQRFDSQLLARAPLSIKQSDDLGKLQTLQAGAAAVGAESELCALDGRPALFVLLENKPRGPVPRVLVEERVEHGLWPSALSVAEVGSSTWLAYAELAKSVQPDIEEQPARAFDADARATTDRSASYAPTHAADRGHSLARVAVSTLADTPLLPPGEAIHAGFWRRSAALLIDGLLIGAAMMVVQVVLGLGALGRFADGSANVGAIVGSMMMLMLIAIVGQWLYFALFESASAQATPGKRALGIKVVDETGGRIGFGRASGRYFGKIVSGMIFNIGYMLAGWTERKQALHDMMAGTLVVFRDVSPGQPLPQARPPMPWYGWLLNILMFGGFVLGMAVMWYYAGLLGGLADGRGGF
jgi:uncharacterized RDD family membrane protein YckC